MSDFLSGTVLLNQWFLEKKLDLFEIRNWFAYSGEIYGVNVNLLKKEFENPNPDKIIEF